MDATHEPQGFPTDSDRDGIATLKPLKELKPWRKAFIRSLRRHGSATDACRAAGISLQRAYLVRKQSARFARAWTEALREARRRKIDLAETEAFHRAVHGRTEPVYQGGVLVGHKRKRSDGLLVRVLEAEAPRKYAKRTESRTSGANILVSVEMRAAFLGDASVRQAVCARDTADEAIPSAPASLPHEDRPS